MTSCRRTNASETRDHYEGVVLLRDKQKSKVEGSYSDYGILNQLILISAVFMEKIEKEDIIVFFLFQYEGISKSFEPNMERARNLDLFCFIFQRSPLPTPHTCPI